MLFDDNIKKGSGQNLKIFDNGLRRIYYGNG